MIITILALSGLVHGQTRKNPPKPIFKPIVVPALPSMPTKSDEERLPIIVRPQSSSVTGKINRYGLYGKLQALSGKGAELGEILLQAAKLMENAKGCVLYVVSKTAAEPDSIYIYEVWENQADHDNSLSVAGVGELIKRAIPLLAEKPSNGTTLEVLGGRGI